MIHSPGYLANGRHHVVNRSINTKLASCFETCQNAQQMFIRSYGKRKQFLSYYSKVIATSSAFAIPFKRVFASCEVSFPLWGHAQMRMVDGARLKNASGVIIHSQPGKGRAAFWRLRRCQPSLRVPIAILGYAPQELSNTRSSILSMDGKTREVQSNDLRTHHIFFVVILLYTKQQACCWGQVCKARERQWHTSNELSS